MRKVTHMLQCLGEDEISLVLAEVHKGVGIIHFGGKTLAHKILTAGYYWLTLIKDIIVIVKKCNQC